MRKREGIKEIVPGYENVSHSIPTVLEMWLTLLRYYDKYLVYAGGDYTEFGGSTIWHLRAS
jgi:hypothetical protein